MFDIDGTLVDSTGFDGALYAQAVREVLHVDVDETWQSYRNVTDSGILDELLGQPQFGRSREELRARVKRRFTELVHDYVASRPQAVREIPGAKALLETLYTLPAVRVAVATGGWLETATLKLTSIGCNLATIASATSSDELAKTRIMQLAEHRAMHGELPRTRTYFGDTNYDKRASAELGYRFIAVGRRVEHEHRFDDFADREAVLACLGL